MKRLSWSSTVPKNAAFHLARIRARKYGSKVPYHTQDFPEIFWIEEGSAVHWVNGKNIPLERGDLVFVRCTDRHRVTATDRTGCVFVNLAFKQSTVDFVRRRYFQSTGRWFWREGGTPDSIHLDPDHLGWLARWVDRLALAERSLVEVELFLMELLREVNGERLLPKKESGPEWLVEALRQIGDPEVLAGGTSALARKAGRTPQHLNATLMKYRGMTATGAVNEARMRFAARELRTSTKKIMEICLDCGFRNLAHFYNLFEGFAGMTPRAYRHRHQRLIG